MVRRRGMLDGLGRKDSQDLLLSLIPVTVQRGDNNNNNEHSLPRGTIQAILQHPPLNQDMLHVKDRGANRE
jgi:hypothetical protein